MDQRGYQGDEGEYGNYVVWDAFEMVSDAELRDSGQLPNIHEWSRGDRFAWCCSREQSLDLWDEFT